MTQKRGRGGSYLLQPDGERVLVEGTDQTPAPKPVANKQPKPKAEKATTITHNTATGGDE